MIATINRAGTSVKKILLTGRKILRNSAGKSLSGRKRIELIAGAQGISRLPDRQVLHLLTGEMRRMLIARALLLSPALLILDEPFIGLDIAARKNLSQILDELMRYGQQII